MLQVSLRIIMFKVQNISKSYTLSLQQGIKTNCELKDDTDNQKFIAVENISFDIKKSEILGVLGENGSGKSTLLKILAGLLEPSNGKIILNSTLIGGPSSKLVAGYDNIKLIHQNYNLFPNISLEENIKYHLRFYNEAYIKLRTAYLLQLCQLDQIKNKLPRQTSGGEQQRTAIACALVTPTDVLLLDEPFSNLDVFNSEILKNQIIKIVKKEKLYAVFVTHNADDALSTSDKLAVIKNGKIISLQSPIETYHYPKNEYIASITGLANVFFTSKLSKLIRLDVDKLKHKKCMIRPEFVFLANTGISSIVKKCSFRGDKFLIECTAHKLHFLLYTQNSLVIDSQVFIQLDIKKIVFFYD